MKTFGEPLDRALLGFLNAVLKPARPIVNASIRNPFNLRDLAAGRKFAFSGYHFGRHE